jgi:hypothetical protein
VRQFCMASVQIGLAGVIALLAIAGCGQDEAPEAVSARQSSSPHAQVTESVHPSRAVITASAQPGTHVAGPCRVRDLSLRFRRAGDGAGGHSAHLLDFHNVGGTRCLLSGYPRRVIVSEPGQPPVVARRGGFFPVRAAKPMAPGGVTTIVIETDTYCRAHPLGAGRPPGRVYHHVSVALMGSVICTTLPEARGLDLGCGVYASRFGRWL